MEVGRNLFYTGRKNEWEILLSREQIVAETDHMFSKLISLSSQALNYNSQTPKIRWRPLD